MNTTLSQALLDTLDYLKKLSREGTRLEEAKARLCSLQRQYPDTGMDLLWEEEAYDGSMHYDTLLHLGDGTISLSFCPDRALPWPMRGVQRWSEADLVRVNNTILKIQEAIAYLDFIWDETQIMDRLVNVCLIQEALDKDPFELSDSELQRAMDGFRRTHKLYKPEDTYRWMEQHGMKHEQLERYVADEAMIAKLRDRITVGQEEDYFERHQADFDTFSIARIELSDEESAHWTYEQILSGEIGFYEAAQRRFLSVLESAEPPLGEIFSVVQRGQMSPELRVAVLASTSRDVLGPVRIKESYVLIRVLSLVPACLDNRTRNAIKGILFDEWLAQRRQAARIEWYWGNTATVTQKNSLLC